MIEVQVHSLYPSDAELVKQIVFILHRWTLVRGYTSCCRGLSRLCYFGWLKDQSATQPVFSSVVWCFNVFPHHLLNSDTFNTTTAVPALSALVSAEKKVPTQIHAVFLFLLRSRRTIFTPGAQQIMRNLHDLEDWSTYMAVTMYSSTAFEYNLRLY